MALNISKDILKLYIAILVRNIKVEMTRNIDSPYVIHLSYPKWNGYAYLQDQW